MKAIGIDYGKIRIGVSCTDETGIVVRGLKTINHKVVNDQVKKISEIVSYEKPDVIVFGLPLDHNDNETYMSSVVRKFAGRIKQVTGIPVEFIDESYTSKSASNYILSKKKKYRRDKGYRDRIAACLILESYIKEKNGNSIPDSNTYR